MIIESILENYELSRKFGGIDIKVIIKDWGREIWIVNTPLYCGKILEVKKGWSSSLHYHKEKDETFLLHDGLLLMQYNHKEWIMVPGSVQQINSKDNHRFTAFKDSRIFEFSTHHNDDDTVRLEVSTQVDLYYLKREYNIV